MFYLFFAKYKHTFHKGSFKNISLIEYIFLGVALISSGVFLFQSLIGHQPKLFVCSLLITIFDGIAISIYEKRKEKKLIDARTENYKSNIIEKLIEMLKDDKYNLYNQKGIDWLIACCNENIEPKKPLSTGSTTLPIFTLAYGVLLKDMPSESVWSTTLGVITLIVIFLVSTKYIMPYLRENITNPDIMLYKYLKSELEYIRIQYNDTQPIENEAEMLSGNEV